MGRLLARGVLVVVAVLVEVAGLTAPGAVAAPREGFGWPLAGTPAVLRPFRPPATDYGPGHRGVDLGAAAGDPVLAAGAGRVTYAGVLAGRGVVAVTHDSGLRTTYEPVRADVGVGDLVGLGDVLGELAAGHGSCPGDCLHWGLRRGDAYLDPLTLVEAGPVRLLPVRAIDGTPDTPTTADPGAAGADSPGPVMRTAGAAVALGSLLLGTTLLARRPPRPPPRQLPGPLGGPPARPPDPGPTAVSQGLVDLQRERFLRRTG